MPQNPRSEPQDAAGSGNVVIELFLYIKSIFCGPLPEFFGGVGCETALTKKPTLWYAPCGTLALVDVPDFDGAPDSEFP
jgi:hypothetical protein